MIIEPLTLAQAETMRIWRNKNLQACRTSEPLSAMDQGAWYDERIEPKIDKWYFATDVDWIGIGAAGLQKIEWINRRCELSLIINPGYRNKGHGTQLLDMILEKAFDFYNLENVWGEVFECADFKWWNRRISERGGDLLYTVWPTKYWQGTYYNSMFFNISRKQFTDHRLLGTEAVHLGDGSANPVTTVQ